MHAHAQVWEEHTSLDKLTCIRQVDILQTVPRKPFFLQPGVDTASGMSRQHRHGVRMCADVPSIYVWPQRSLLRGCVALQQQLLSI